MSKHYNRIIKSIINNEYMFSVIAKIWGVLAGLLFVILLNRYLGATLKGEYAVITNYLNIFTIILGLGINQVYPIFRKKDNQYLETYLSNVKPIFLLLSIVMFSIIFWKDENYRTNVTLLLLPICVITSIVDCAVQVEYPKVKNTYYVILNILEILLLFGLLLLTKANYEYLILIIAFKAVVSFLLACVGTKRNVIKIPFKVSDIKSYIKYGFLPMLTVFLMTLNYRVDIIMLDGRVSLEEIGIYSLAVNLADKLWLIPDALKEILLSRLAKGKGIDELAKVIRISIAGCLLTIIGIILFGKSFIVLLFGAEFTSAYNIMLIFLVGIISMIFYKMIYAYNIVNCKQMVNFLILLMSAIINVILNYFFINLWKSEGAALATLISYSLCGLTFLIYFKVKSGFTYRDIVLIKKDDIFYIIKKIKGN